MTWGSNLPPEDYLHYQQEAEWSVMLASAADPGIIIIIHAPEYEDNGSGINPEW